MNRDHRSIEPEVDLSSGDGGLSRQGAQQLSDSLMSIINQAVQDHQQWMQQWYQWANSLMMQMQSIPPQAQMDFDQRSLALTQFILRFKPAAQVLAKAGLDGLSKSISTMEDGAREDARVRQQSNAKILAGDIKSQQEIAKIWSDTNRHIGGLHQKTMTENSRAMDRAHADFMRTLRS